MAGAAGGGEGVSRSACPVAGAAFEADCGFAEGDQERGEVAFEGEEGGETEGHDGFAGTGNGCCEYAGGFGAVVGASGDFEASGELRGEAAQRVISDQKQRP